MAFNVEIKNRNRNGEDGDITHTLYTIEDTTGQTEGHGLGQLDTPEEAQRILAQIPDHNLDNKSVFIGDQDVTEQLQRLLTPARTPPPVPSAPTPSAPANGVSPISVELSGQVVAGIGENALSGPGVEATVRYRHPVSGSVIYTPGVGIAVGYGETSGTMPGGPGTPDQSYTSSARTFTVVGRPLDVEADVGWVFLRGSPFVEVGGFTTPDSTKVNAPRTCTAGDLGRQQCNPLASPTTLDVGSTGLFNPDSGSARGTSGIVVGYGLDVSAGYDIYRSPNHTVSAIISAGLGRQTFVPTDGHPLTQTTATFGLGIEWMPGRRSPQATTPPPPPRTITDPPLTHSDPLPLNQALSLDAIRTMGGLPQGAEILGVQLDRPRHAEDTSAPYTVQASWMTPGSHDLRIRYLYRGQEHIQPVAITVGEITDGGPYGVVPVITPNVARPVALPGVAAGPLTIGSVEVTSAAPRNSVLAIYVDGNEVGTVRLQPTSPGTDHTTPITIPATVTDGAHQIGRRIRRPGETEVRFNDRPITINPATAIGIPAPAMGAASYSRRSRDRATVVLNTTRAIASGVTISIDGRPMTASEFNGALVAGANTIPLINPSLRGQMITSVHNVRAGTYPVVINIPGEAAINLQLVITRGSVGNTCPTGQVRGANGACAAPQTAAPPVNPPVVTPPAVRESAQ